MIADVMRRAGRRLLGIKSSTITTSNAATATAYSNQRKIDRTSNGVLWALYAPTDTGPTGTVAASFYSLDNGATWTYSGVVANGSGGSSSTYTENFSVFIDADDYAHVVFKDNDDGFIYYRRGTPNAGRTAWTWSAASLIFSTTNSVDYPDIVVHRTPGTSPTEYDAHIVFSFHSAFVDRAVYKRVHINGAGTITAITEPSGTVTGGSGTSALSLGGDYENSVHKFPSIDFNHTGDGKTAAGGTPHLYVGWSAGATGAGKGVRFRKATYAAGSWTWGTEREIDSTRYIASSDYWFNCMFDGTRVVLTGFVFDGSSNDLILHDRDAADTTTTTRLLADNQGLGTLHFRLFGSASYDASGNVYQFGRDASGAAGTGTRKIHYAKWDRSTGVLSAPVTIDANGNDSPHVSAKRGYSDNRIEWVYTDGTASPYNVNFYGLDS